jgi:hypothetical protein
MEPQAVVTDTIPFLDDREITALATQCVDLIKEVYAKTRIGSLLMEEGALSHNQLRDALTHGENGTELLGKTLAAMGVLDRKEVARVLDVQKQRRVSSLATHLTEKLRIGWLLLQGRLITTRQLTEALETQKKTGRFLGEILVERGAVSRTALHAFLRLQENLKRITAVSCLALLLGAVAVPSVAMEIPRADREATGCEEMATPTCTPNPKYERARDFLKTAREISNPGEQNAVEYQRLLKADERPAGKWEWEDRSAWLYGALLKDGFEDIHLVVGKHREDTASFDTWVMWSADGKMYILDPNYETDIWELEQIPAGYYQAAYSLNAENHASAAT